MKTVYLVRHAKAVSRSIPIPDAARPLRPRGRRHARDMARYVMQHGPQPQLILSSPARRAIETARLCAAVWAYPADRIVQCAALYEGAAAAESDVLLELIQTLDDRDQTVMIVGHDPLLSAGAHVLDAGCAVRLPTCGVVGVVFRVPAWSDIMPARGTLRFFHAPARRTDTRTG